LKKLDEVKALVEKYKNEKSSLSKQLKELQAKFNQSSIKIMELQQEKVKFRHHISLIKNKDDDKQRFEKTLKENEIKGGGPAGFGTNVIFVFFFTKLIF